MTVKPLGKLLLLIVLVGLLAGGYRLYRSLSASGGALPRRTGASDAPQRNDGGARTGTPTGAGDDTAPDNTAPDNGGGKGDGGAVEMALLTSGSKNDWLAEQITKFNDANQGKYRITTHLMETREAFQAILNDKEKPVLWSPSSPIWANRLGEVWPQKHNDRQILDVGDDKTFGLFLRTPMVFLTTKTKARILRPLLEGAGGPWAALRDLSQGRRKMPSGSFRFAYADPVTSNSGFYARPDSGRLREPDGASRRARPGGERSALFCLPCRDAPGLRVRRND